MKSFYFIFFAGKRETISSKGNNMCKGKDHAGWWSLKAWQ